MSNSKLIKSLELSRSLMRSQIEALREEAEDLCTNYWIEWKERNHLEFSARFHLLIRRSLCHLIF